MILNLLNIDPVAIDLLGFLTVPQISHLMQTCKAANAAIKRVADKYNITANLERTVLVQRQSTFWYTTRDTTAHYIKKSVLIRDATIMHGRSFAYSDVSNERVLVYSADFEMGQLWCLTEYSSVDDVRMITLYDGTNVLEIRLVFRNSDHRCVFEGGRHAYCVDGDKKTSGASCLITQHVRPINYVMSLFGRDN